MIQVKCIKKFRDNNNKIYGYRLIDINGQTQDVQSKNLKQAIASGKIHVVNLTLTSDNRLVDTTEKQLQNKKVLGKAPEIKKSYTEQEYDWLVKISTAIFKGLDCGEPEYCGDGESHELESLAIDSIDSRSLAFELLDQPKEEYRDDFDGDIEEFESEWGLTYIIYGSLKEKRISLYLGSRTFEMNEYRVDAKVESKDDIIKLINAGKNLYRKYKVDEKKYQDTLTEERIDYFRQQKDSYQERQRNRKPAKDCKTFEDFFS